MQRAEPAPDTGGEYRHLFESAPEPYLATDAAGRIQLANARAGALLGSHPDELAGSAIADHLAEDEAEALAAMLERVVHDGAVESWEVRLRDTAAASHALVSIGAGEAPERSGQRLRWILHDALPLQLLRDRIRDVVETSQADTATLRALSEWQASLLGAAGQDMAIPLRVIATTIDSLLEADGLTDRHTTRAMLERTAEQVGKLRALLPTLLQLGKVQLRRPPSQRRLVDLERVIDMALHELEPIGRTVAYAFDVDRAEVDPDQLARVVVELVTHAADHAPADAALTIGAAATGVDVELHLDVPGYEVADDVRDALVSPLPRAGTATADHVDGELGLSLVAVFARMHGGRARVVDGPDGGASFRVLLSNALPDRHEGHLTSG